MIALVWRVLLTLRIQSPRCECKDGRDQSVTERSKTALKPFEERRGRESTELEREDSTEGNPRYRKVGRTLARP